MERVLNDVVWTQLKPGKCSGPERSGAPPSPLLPSSPGPSLAPTHHARHTLHLALETCYVVVITGGGGGARRKGKEVGPKVENSKKSERNQVTLLLLLLILLLLLLLLLMMMMIMMLVVVCEMMMLIKVTRKRSIKKSKSRKIS